MNASASDRHRLHNPLEQLLSFTPLASQATMVGLVLAVVKLG
jgi:hypothetical protein